MKQILSNAIAVGFILVLWSCNMDSPNRSPDIKGKQTEQSEPINENWNQLNLPEVSISYPKNWTLDTSGVNETLFILVSQKIDSLDQFSATLNLFSEFIGTARLSEYVDVSEKQIQDFMQGSRLRQSKDTLIQGQSFHKVQFVASSDGRELIFDQLYTVRDQKAYVLTYNCEAKEYDQMNPLATKVVQSMRLK